MAETLLQRLQWQTDTGQILDGDRRYLMMRPDVLMGVFRNLPMPIQQHAFEALQESVRHHGGKSAHDYFESLNNDADLLLETIADFSAQLGWGVWSIRRDADSISVHVRNSPFAHGFGPHDHAVCYPIVGMLETVGKLALGAPVDVRETACAAQGHSLCIFRVSLAS